MQTKAVAKKKGDEATLPSCDASRVARAMNPQQSHRCAAPGEQRRAQSASLVSAWCLSGMRARSSIGGWEGLCRYFVVKVYTFFCTCCTGKRRCLNNGVWSRWGAIVGSRRASDQDWMPAQLARGTRDWGGFCVW